MGAWAQYGLEDFLLFSASTYQRLFELHNADWWPAQVFAQALGVAIVWAAWRRPSPRAARAVWAALAAAWLVAAWAWHLERFAAIQWAAPAFAAGFALQAVAMAAWALHPACGRRLAKAPPPARIRIALAVAGVALVAWPALPLLLGRPVAQAEWFGLTPDPTALLTLAVLLLRPSPAWLWPLPLAWCVVTGATLWPMQAPHAVLAPLVAVIALVTAGAARVPRVQRDSLRR
jgi:hypothetical protein